MGDPAKEETTVRVKCLNCGGTGHVAAKGFEPDMTRQEAHIMARPALPEGISRCGQYLGYHVYMAGPCFDTLEQALAYKAELDREGVKWKPQP